MTQLFKRLDPFGNPNVGVYIRVTSTHLFVPHGLTPQNMDDLRAAFDLDPTPVSIGGSPLIGSLVAANSNGAVVADFATDAEMAVFKDAGLQVMRLEHTRLNAAGNNILCNDEGAVVHPDLSDDTVEQVETTIGVPTVRGQVAGLFTVGSAAVATNKGVLSHPLSSEVDLTFLKQSLHATARIGTVNHGHGLVGAGCSANQSGIACGAKTTGIELGRIEEALGFLE